MTFIDTHAHLYDDRFAADREETLRRALDAGVKKIYLPNCDRHTIPPMMDLAEAHPEQCFPMMGLHPCYVKEDYKEELDIAEAWLQQGKFAAVGEIGLDYYWDKTFVAEQKEAFNIQMDWALHLQLPIVIHTRESVADGIAMVRQKQNGNLRGVFHCFSGTLEEAKQIVDLGFLLGIGGVLTYKKTDLPEILKQISPQHLVLETDAPYLAPVPYRGKRNESSYIPIIAQRLAAAKGVSLQEIAAVTTANAERLFFGGMISRNIKNLV
ncbi:MAG: TatD family hydrolase [Edaphocola sp.]